jgi:hypothetical protein
MENQGRAALGVHRFMTRTGFSAEPRPENPVFRIINAEYMASAILAVVFIVLACLFLTSAFGGKANVTSSAIGATIGFCLGALFLYGIFWGLCAIVRNGTLVLRFHVLTQSLPMEDIVAFDVQQNRLMLKPVLTIMVITKSGKAVRTPLVATRTLAGEARLNEIGFYMNQCVHPTSP